MPASEAIRRLVEIGLKVKSRKKSIPFWGTFARVKVALASSSEGRNMERLATLGVVIVFLGTLGKFLDKHHFEESTIERIRVKLIGFFIFLYELPDNLRTRFSPLFRCLDKLHKARAFDLRTGKAIEPEANWTIWIRAAQISFALLFAIIDFYEGGPLWVCGGHRRGS